MATSCITCTVPQTRVKFLYSKSYLQKHNNLVLNPLQISTNALNRQVTLSFLSRMSLILWFGYPTHATMSPRTILIQAFRYTSLAALSISWHCAVSLSAYGTEDVEIPTDEERRLPKHTVTASRGNSGSIGIGSMLSIVTAGSNSELDSLDLTGDNYTYALACRRNPDSISCRLLACEVAPESKECEYRLDPVVVTGERPDTSNSTTSLSLNVKFSFQWIVNIDKSIEGVKNALQRKITRGQMQI